MHKFLHVFRTRPYSLRSFLISCQWRNFIKSFRYILSIQPCLVWKDSSWQHCRTVCSRVAKRVQLISTAMWNTISSRDIVRKQVEPPEWSGISSFCYQKLSWILHHIVLSHQPNQRHTAWNVTLNLFHIVKDLVLVKKVRRYEANRVARHPQRSLLLIQLQKIDKTKLLR